MARSLRRVYSGKDSLRALPSRPVLSSVETDWDGLVLEAHRVPPSEIKEHRIAFHLFSLITHSDGARRHWREGKFDRSIELRPGVISIFSPCDLYTNRGDQTHTLTALAVSPVVIDRVCAELKMSSAELRPQHGVADATLEHMILALKSDVEHGCPAGPLFGESLIQVLAAYALRRYGVGGPQQLLHRGGLTPMQLRRVRDYIEANLHRTLHVSDLATVAGLSSYHFGKMFKLSTGQSVHKFVLNRRVARASDFLQNDDLPISYIGHLVGLPNQSHFTKVFRDRTSMTPRSWRVAGYKPLD